MHPIHITIRPFGNSRGIVIPKPLLAQSGLEDAVEEVSVENGALVIRKPIQAAGGLSLAPREFWKDRVGDYRIISSTEDGTLRIRVVKFGSSREV